MVEVNVGDKVTIRKELRDREPDIWTARKHYTVNELVSGIPVVTNDKGRHSYLKMPNWYTVVKRAETAEVVEIVDGGETVQETGQDEAEVAKEMPAKIGKDEIVGQDTNKHILQVAINKNLPTLLIGETGTGKTTLIREQAIAHGRDLIRFSITGETTVDEFVGKYELEAGKTVWKDGVLLDAMKNGKWLVADEINVALPEILFVLHSLLDDDKYVTVSQHEGEVVRPHEDFRFFATMNPVDEYAGTKELNKAFQSRFNVILQVHYPSPKIEARIVADKSGVSLADATKMADVAAALRKAKNDQKIFYTCSTRDLLHWGTLCGDLDPGEAFRVSILNKAGADSDAVKDIYKHVIGRYIKIEDPKIELSIDFFEKQRDTIIEERKKFEEDKEQIRKDITQEIISKLTGGEAEVKAHKQGKKAEQADLADVLNGNE